MPLQTLFDFRLPTRLLHGPGSIRCLPELLPSDRKVLVVTDPGLRAAVIAGRSSRQAGQVAVDLVRQLNRDRVWETSRGAPGSAPSPQSAEHQQHHNSVTQQEVASRCPFPG